MRLPWLPRRVRISGNSMLPALKDGELRFIRTDPLATGGLRRGHIVVLRHPWDPSLKLIKRVAAVPGDAAPTGTGTLGAPSEDDRTLGEGEYLVLSDNAAEGLDDGRLFGPIPLRLIEGRLMGRVAAPRKIIPEPAEDRSNP